MDTENDDMREVAVAGLFNLGQARKLVKGGFLKWAEITDIPLLKFTKKGWEARRPRRSGPKVSLTKEQMSREIKKGIDYARSHGRVIGNVSKTLLPEPERSRVIKAWLDAGGKSYRTLARDLGGVGMGTVVRLVKEARDGREEPETVEID